jgi:hypothetical protein
MAGRVPIGIRIRVPVETVARAGWICARLGGRNGCYGKPGPIVIHEGLLRLKTDASRLEPERHCVSREETRPAMTMSYGFELYVSA